MPQDDIAERLESLLRANQAVVRELDLPAVLRLIAGEAVRLVDARYGALGVLTPDGSELEQFIHVGVDAETAAHIGSLPRGHGLLGAVISDPRPIRVDDIQKDSRSEGYPAAHPPMHSFLGVPIRVRDTVFGNLYLTEKRSGDFTSADEELLTALAATAGVAIANARLFDDTERRQRWAQASAEIMASLITESTEASIDLLAHRVADLADADLVSVVLPAGRDDLSIEAAAGDVARPVGTRFARRGSLAGEVMASADPLLVPTARRRGGDPDDGILGPTMVIPLAGSGDPLGVLTISRLPARQTFTTEDLIMAAEFAGHASVALELGHARRDAARLALLEDRGRIARDLHDHVIQRLFGAGLGLQAVLGRIEDPLVAAAISREVDVLDAAIAEIRTAIFTMTAPATSKQASLRHRVIDIIGELGHAFSEPPRLAFSGPIDLMTSAGLGDDVAATVREGLSNAAHHAEAQRVDVTLALADGMFTVTVSDDGRGMPADPRRRGLDNLRARAAGRRGSFEVSPGSPSGTVLVWSVPIDVHPERAQP